ncbi:MAG: hypothetical protein ACPGUV_07100 [Polyangiales bacterium]
MSSLSTTFNPDDVAPAPIAAPKGFRAWEVLRTSMRIVIARIGTFIGLQAVLAFAMCMLMMLAGALIWPIMQLGSPWLAVVPVLISYLSLFVVAFITQAACAELTVGQLTGPRVRLSTALRHGIGRWGLLLRTGLLGWVAIALATLLLVIPGYIMMITLAVALPVASQEDKRKAVECLYRSAELTSGYRWRILSFFLLLALLFLVLCTPFVLLAATMLSTYVTSSMSSAAASPLPAMFWLITPLGAAVISVFWSVAMVAPAVMYQRLRVLQDGPEQEALREVFA